MSDIRSQSTKEGGASYIIFAVDEVWNSYPSDFWETLKALDIGGKRLIGVYKGEPESSYIVNARHWSTIQPYITRQESVLVLGPVGRHGARPATLHYISRVRLPENLGYFFEVDDDDVSQRDHTYDCDTGKTYICAHNFPEFPLSLRKLNREVA